LITLAKNYRGITWEKSYPDSTIEVWGDLLNLIRLMTGLLILKQLKNLSDEQFVEAGPEPLTGSSFVE
jgi:hypothetical protein